MLNTGNTVTLTQLDKRINFISQAGGEACKIIQIICLKTLLLGLIIYPPYCRRQGCVLYNLTLL